MPRRSRVQHQQRVQRQQKRLAKAKQVRVDSKPQEESTQADYRDLRFSPRQGICREQQLPYPRPAVDGLDCLNIPVRGLVSTTIQRYLRQNSLKRNRINGTGRQMGMGGASSSAAIS